VDLSTIRTEVRERLAETSADFFTDDEVDRAINEAVRRFCAEEQWPFLLTEWSLDELEEDTDGSAVAEIDLPTNVSLRNVFNLAVSGSSLAHPQMLERVDSNEGFRLRHAYEDITGAPRWYYITRTNASEDESSTLTYTLKLIPAPDTTDYQFEAQYMVQPAYLSGDTDEPMVPEEYHEAICAWAAGKLFLKELGISQKSSEQFQLYQKVLEQARADLRSFALDEVVAWGRRLPRYDSYEPRMRIPPTLGG
jgi:hypothetical protein